jgi:ferredoxin-NADP reductase/ferredoxin
MIRRNANAPDENATVAELDAGLALRLTETTHGVPPPAAAPRTGRIQVSIRPGCNGMGSCVRLAPDVFRIDEKTGKAVVLLDECSAHREAVLASARSCPLVAVTIDGVALDEPVDEVAVVSVTTIAPNIIELRMQRRGFVFVPGQYVFLRLRDAAGEFFRTYSVASGSDGQVMLCIRLLPDGRAGKVLMALQPGDRVGLSRAKGEFVLRSPDRPKLFVAAGTGLAPVLPMCLAAPQARKRIIVGARTVQDHIWLDALRAIPNTEVVAITQEADPAWQGRTGLVTAPLHDADIEAGAWPEVYTCGSPRMVEAVRETLIVRGFAPDVIHADSFTSSGSAVAVTTASAAEVRLPFDWAGLLRRVHYISAAPLAAIMLFYALTGFVANRSDWFGAQAPAPQVKTLPAGVALEREALAPVLAALTPDPGLKLERWKSGANPEAVFLGDDGMGWQVLVDGEQRMVRVRRCGVISEGVALEPAAVAAVVGPHLSGEPDLAHATAEEGEVEVEFASVWGVHRVTVDGESRLWTAASTSPPLVMSLVDLHRSKHAGAWHRVIVDVAALVLAFVTLSGAALGLMTAVVKRRRQALVLLSVSVVLLVFLIGGR